MTPRALSGVVGLSVASVALFTCLALWKVGKAADSLAALPSGLSSLPQAIVDADTAIKKVSRATDQLSGVISAERKAQTHQLQESAKVIAAVKEVLVRTDCQLNGGPGCVGTLPSATKLLSTSQQKLQIATEQSAKIFSAASLFLDSANRRISDPRIDSLMDGFQVSQLHLNGILANTESMTAHGDHVAAVWDKKLTTPASLAKTITLDTLHLITVPITAF